MTKSEIEAYLYKHIPVTQALGVKVVHFSNSRVELSAPLSNNINHRFTAFGGSISSLLITTAWSYLRLLFDDEGEGQIPRIVIGKSNTNYLKPIVSDFSSELLIPDEDTLNHFIEMYHRFGKARITLKAKIEEDDATYAEFEGDFVVMERK
ncbi:MAG: thioesterase [Balneolaceae bacterium]|nr:thioesterase [Balneolaceae bacterium]